MTLLANAFKFTPNDDGGRISIQVEVLTDTMLIQICDNGQDITPEDQPHVFDLNLPVDRVPKGPVDPQEILKRMNGDITATSVYKKGSLSPSHNHHEV